MGEKNAPTFCYGVIAVTRTVSHTRLIAILIEIPISFSLPSIYEIHLSGNLSLRVRVFFFFYHSTHEILPLAQRRVNLVIMSIHIII